MVEGALPVFQLYKKHLLQSTSSTERTSEMFWRQMEAHGGVNVDRSKFDSNNLPLLRSVFMALSSETPSNLISREFFLSSPSPLEWYRAGKNYTRDLGLSSAVGTVLGIGDRHLDNMLVDTKEGNFVHVDFSLMFGRGRDLPVPEVVPFRLTQNLREALQFPGLDGGAFRVHLEGALQKMRGGEEFVGFCAQTVAFACQAEEEVTLNNPRKVKKAELKAAVEILRFRMKNVWKLARQTM
jgi:PI-3-kinase-related kinase SMG-1